MIFNELMLKVSVITQFTISPKGSSVPVCMLILLSLLYNRTPANSRLDRRTYTAKL